MNQGLTSIGIPTCHCCESGILSKRSTLVFCANACYLARARLREKRSYYLQFRLCIPSCIDATRSALLQMLNSFQNQSNDVREITAVRRLNNAFRFAPNSIFSVCVQTLFTNCTLQKGTKQNQIKNTKYVQFTLQIINTQIRHNRFYRPVAVVDGCIVQTRVGKSACLRLKLSTYGRFQKCLAFWPVLKTLTNLGEFWRNFFVVPYSGILQSKCLHANSNKHPSWQLNIPNSAFYSQGMEIVSDAKPLL